MHINSCRLRFLSLGGQLPASVEHHQRVQVYAGLYTINTASDLYEELSKRKD